MARESVCDAELVTIRQPATASRYEGVKRATLPSRAFSHLIDGIIVSLPLWALTYLVVSVLDIRVSGLRELLFGLAGAAYEIGFVARSGQTPGRHLLDIRISLLDGAPPGLRSSVIRYVTAPGVSLSAALAVAPLDDAARTIIGVAVFSAWVWTILRDPQRRGWHDKAAGTMVFDEREPGS